MGRGGNEGNFMRATRALGQHDLLDFEISELRAIGIVLARLEALRVVKSGAATVETYNAVRRSRARASAAVGPMSYRAIFCSSAWLRLAGAARPRRGRYIYSIMRRILSTLTCRQNHAPPC